MYRRFWLIPIAVLGTTLLYRHHSSLKQIRANVRAFDLPTAEIYDALVASPGRVLRQRHRPGDGGLPERNPARVGGGPGRLAVRLARAASGLSLTGVDIMPAMVEWVRTTPRTWIASTAPDLSNKEVASAMTSDIKGLV